MKNRHKAPPKDSPRDVTIAAVVKEAVRRYKRKVWWADTRDMSQHAWMTALEAHRTFKPERMDDFYWYAWRAVVIQLRNHLLRASAPVTAPQRKLKELEGIYREDLKYRPDEGDGAASAEEHMAQVQQHSRLRAEMLEFDPGLAQLALDDDDKAIRHLARSFKKG